MEKKVLAELRNSKSMERPSIIKKLLNIQFVCVRSKYSLSIKL